MRPPSYRATGRHPDNHCSPCLGRSRGGRCDRGALPVRNQRANAHYGKRWGSHFLIPLSTSPISSRPFDCVPSKVSAGLDHIGNVLNQLRGIPPSPPFRTRWSPSGPSWNSAARLLQQPPQRSRHGDRNYQGSRSVALSRTVFAPRLVRPEEWRHARPRTLPLQPQETAC